MSEQDKKPDFSAGLGLPKKQEVTIPDTLSLNFSAGVSPTPTEVDTYKSIDDLTPRDLASKSKDERIGEFWDKYLPDVLKEGYNNSIDGIAQEILTGNKRFGVPNRDVVDRGIMYDVGVAAASFLLPTPSNVATLGLGAGTGKVAQVVGGRKATEFIANTMIKKGFMSKGSKKEFVDNVSRIAFTEAGAFGAQEGFYTGAAEMRDAVINSEFDISKYQKIKDKNKRYLAIMSDIGKQSDPLDYLRGYGVGVVGAAGFGAGKYAFTANKGMLLSNRAKGKSRGIESGIAGEIGAIMLSSGLIYERDFESEENSPFFQNLVLASGITAAAGLPRNTFNSLRASYKKGKSIPLTEVDGKILRGLNWDEISEIIPESVELQRYLRQGSDVFKRVSEPLIRLTGRKGDPKITEQVSLSIKDLNKKRLPAGMASGPYANVEIVGSPVKTGGKKGKITVETRTPEPIPTSLDAKIDRKSLEVTETGAKFNVKIGRNTYALDEVNSELFLKNYTSQPTLAKNLKDKNRGYFALTLERRRALRQLRADSNAGKNGLQEGDYIRAIENTANEYNIEKWSNLKEPPKIKDMTDVELRLVTEQFGDIQFIKNHENFIRDEFGSVIDDITGVAGESIIVNFGKTLVGSLGSDLKSPAARTAVRLLSKLDRNIVTAATTRITDLQKAIGMDTSVLSMRKALPRFMTGYNPFRNQNMENWIVGNKVELSNGKTIPSGFDEYRLLDANPKHLITMKSNATKMIKKGNLTDKEVSFLQRRIKTVEQIKTIMDETYDDAIKAKIKVAGRKEWYMPFVISKPIRDTIYTETLSLNEKISKLTRGDLSLDPEVALRNADEATKAKIKKSVEDFVTKLVKSNDPNKKSVGEIFTETRRILDRKGSVLSDVPEYDVWAAVNANIYTDGFKVYAPLEKSRKVVGSAGTIDIVAGLVESKSKMLDKNLLTLFTDYINGSTKRIELSKTFMPDGAFLDKLISRIPEGAEMSGIGAAIGRRVGKNSLNKVTGSADVPEFVIKERDAIRLVKESITGEDALTRQGLFSKGLYSISELEMLSKISLGTATIPNMTQAFISTIPQLGVGSVVRGLSNYVFNPQVRDMVKQSGVTALSLFDEILGGSRALQIGQARLIKFSDPTQAFIKTLKGEMGLKDWFTMGKDVAAKPFMAINLFNKMQAGAAAEDYIRKLVMMYDGKMGLAQNLEVTATMPLINRKAYAKNKLKNTFGIDADEALKYKKSIIDRTYNPANAGEAQMKKKILRGMESYASDSQQGRNFDKDALALNDSYFKPFTLFKRFPIRQSKYALKIVQDEMANGNILSPLYLAASGAFGGSLALKARADLLKYVSGDLRFNSEEERTKYVQLGTGKEISSAMAAGGVLGAYADIMDNNEPFNAISFLVKPVIIDDIERIGSVALNARLNFFNNEYDMNIQTRKNMIKLGPTFGSLINASLSWYAYKGDLPEFTGGPEGKEGTPPPKLYRDNAETRRSYVFQEIQRVILLGTGPGGVPTAKYEDNAEEAAKLASDWNKSQYVKDIPALAINPYENSLRNPFNSKSLNKKFVKEVNKNREYYEDKDFDITQYLED